MTPVIVTPPAVMPVTLAEAMSQTRTDSTDTEADLNRFISAATTFVEEYSGHALITRSYRGWMDDWPRMPRRLGFGSRYARHFDLPMSPLQTVAAITTYDDDDVATVMDPSTYVVSPDAFVGRVTLRTTACWPDVGRAADGIKVEWTAGFGADPTTIPDNYRQAILLMVSHFNEHREAVVGVENRDSSTPLPMGVEALLGPKRIWTV